MSDPKRDLLRHSLATVAYRGGKAVRNAPAAFAEFRGCPSGRTAGRILAHIGDLFDWALSTAQGAQCWNDSKPLPWDKEIERFFASLKRFDDYLASPEPLNETPEKLLQAPIADALTHIGQIAMLRRMADSPIKGEGYITAEIVVGRVGAQQAPPNQEFG
jgi:hypothetical protein